MNTITGTYINKPASLKKHALIAVLIKGAQSKTPRDFMNMPYFINELAVNRSKELVQIYILSDTVQGLTEFKKDYPDAELRVDATLEESQDWEILAFPTEGVNETGSPLDFFFHAFGKLEAEEAMINNLAEKQPKLIDEQSTDGI